MKAITPILVFTVVGACTSPPQVVLEPASNVLSCGFEPATGTLDLANAREAHRQAELRRKLRFQEAIEPGYTLRVTREAVPQGQIDEGRTCFGSLYEAGRLVFEHEYSFEDGLGSGSARTQAQNTFRRVQDGRVGGPDATSCTSCHWRGGPAGSGGLQDNAFLLGDGDAVGSSDPRNPPPLHGVGVVQALAQEMNADLAAIRDDLISQAIKSGADREASLQTHGVNFGLLRVSAAGAIDTSAVVGVDPDLVIKPFGWKGNFASIREFVIESSHLHMGIQSEDLIAQHRRDPDPEQVGTGPDPDDPDADGVKAELTAGQMTALVTYLAAQEMPIVRVPGTLEGAEPAAEGLPPPSTVNFLDEWSRGREVFEELGCANCHRQLMVLKNPVFETTSLVTGHTLRIDLSKHAERPRLSYDEELGGYPVWLFSDLKRHDLGESNAAGHVHRGVAPRQYMTRRLWGVASSGPYFHDGSAPTFTHAIARHGGEATSARDAFEAASFRDQGSLRVYLMSLRREPRFIVPR